MLSIRNAILFGGFFTTLFGLAACGGGGSNLPPAAVEIKTAKVSGYAQLGPIQNGDVSIYSYVDGTRGLSSLATARTDSQGYYSAEIKSDNTPLLVCISNGSYVEESTAVEVALNNRDDEICAVSNFVKETDMTVSITFYTHIAYGFVNNLVKNKLKVDTAIVQANRTISNWVGAAFNTVDSVKKFDIIKTIPKNIRNPNSNVGNLTLEVAYGFANAAVSSFTEDASRTSGKISGLELHVGINSLKFAKEAYLDISENGILDGKGAGSDLFLGTRTQIETNHYRYSLAQHMVRMAGSPFNVTGMRGTQVTPFATAFNESTESIFGITSVRALDFKKPIITVIQPVGTVFFGTQTISATISDGSSLKSVKLEITSAANNITNTLVNETNLINETFNATFNLQFNLDTTANYPDGIYELTFSAMNSLDIVAIPEKRTIQISNKAITLSVVGPSIAAPKRGVIRISGDVVDGAVGIESITITSRTAKKALYKKIIPIVPVGAKNISFEEIIDTNVIFGDGAHSITVTAISTNKTQAVQTVNFSVDNSPPIALIQNVSIRDIFSRTVIVSKTDFTNKKTIITGSVSDTLDGVFTAVQRVEISLAGQSILAQPILNVPAVDPNIINPINVSAAFISIAQFPDGLATLQLSAIDKAGNRSNANLDVIIDNTAPTLVVNLDTPQMNFYIDQVAVIGTASDAKGSGIAKTEIFSDNNAIPIYSSKIDTTLIPNATNFSLWLLSLKDGSHTIEIKSTDNAGLFSSVVRASVMLDTTKPFITPGIPTATKTGAQECTLSFSAEDPGYVANGVSIGSGLKIGYLYEFIAATGSLLPTKTINFNGPGRQAASAIVSLEPFSGGFNRHINLFIADRTNCLFNDNGDGGCQHGVNANLYAGGLVPPLTSYNEDYCVTVTTGSTVCTVTPLPIGANGKRQACSL